MPPASTAAARALLQDFLTDKADRYYWQLSYPSAEATTGLSPTSSLARHSQRPGTGLTLCHFYDPWPCCPG
ncbi:MAG: hypothetical protein WBG32_02650 [Nodosilinea sp.]